jgi:hypothetical protein
LSLGPGAETGLLVSMKLERRTVVAAGPADLGLSIGQVLERQPSAETAITNLQKSLGKDTL